MVWLVRNRNEWTVGDIGLERLVGMVWTGWNLGSVGVEWLVWT